MANAKLQYTPRDAFKAFHNRTERFAAMVCHRRAGKTVASVNELLIRALYTPKKNARYAYIAPFYRQAKDVAWSYLKEAAEPFVKHHSDIRESELRVRLVNGAWITLYGSDNPDTLRGLYLDGVVLDEYGDCRPSLWTEVVLPTLADRRGWAVFIGTPKGRNHFWQVFERSKRGDGWFSLELKASTSGLLSPQDLAEMRGQMTDDQYRQEFECDFAAAVEGTYYAATLTELESKGRFSKTSIYDPEQKVHAACDLGFSDSTAFWFWQTRPDGIAVIDYYENHSKPLSHYLEMLQDRPYNYDTIWLPHDARAKTLQTGRSTIEQFLEHMKDECDVRITPQLKLQHGIDAARMVLRHCFFDEKACYDGVEALRAYKRRFDELTKSFSDKPLHDWSSHGADAFRYMALIVQTQQKVAPVEMDTRAKVNKALASPSGYTLEGLFDDYDKSKHQYGYAKMRI